ncbi:MAG: fatty acid desaturase [Hyphomicrobiales bacterium]|nr:fatty acid desaturase [Hyphomicrobiales bacterium]
MEETAFAVESDHRSEEAENDGSPDELTPDIKRAARQLAAHCSAFKAPDPGRSLVQFLTTAVPFFALCAIMLLSYEHAYWLTLLATLPAAGLLIRLFIIQHDCGHGSYFKSRFINDMIGRAISVVTLTPYECWRQIHARHHATSGDLNHRGAGDIDTLTVKEYLALPRLKRLVYRAYRNPFFILLLGPPLHFLVRQRVPLLLPVSNQTSRNSIMLTNLAIMVVYAALFGVIGMSTFLSVFLPVVLIATWIGGWLFFVQHQFEDTTWDEREGWDFHVAAALGSSYYDLHPVLNWFTGHIGLHHIHHLCAKIPNYRLQECFDTAPALDGVNRLTFLESLKCVNLALWDEDERKLVGFGYLRGLATT